MYMQEVAGLKEEDLRPSVSVDTVAADHDPSSTLTESRPHTCTQVVTVVLLYTGIADTCLKSRCS